LFFGPYGKRREKEDIPHGVLGSPVPLSKAQHPCCWPAQKSWKNCNNIKKKIEKQQLVRIRHVYSGSRILTFFHPESGSSTRVCIRISLIKISF
jgi:hypothetical protein